MNNSLQKVLLIVLGLSLLIPNTHQQATACTECLAPWTTTVEKRPEETEARPNIVIVNDCTEAIPATGNLCAPYWKTHSADGVCCTVASVQKYVDWVNANYKKDGPGVGGLKKKLEKFRDGTGAAAKSEELATAAAKPAAKTGSKNTQAGQDAEVARAKKLQGKAKRTGDTAKTQGEKAIKGLGKCMFRRWRVDYRALCVSCTRKAADFYDAAKENLEVKPAVCKKLMEECAETISAGTIEIEAARIARRLLKEVKNQSGVNELGNPPSDAQLDLANNVLEGDSVTTLAGNSDNTKEFCKMVKRGPLNEGTFGDGQDTNVDAAVAERRLLQALNKYGGYQQRRILAISSTGGYAQNDNGADLESDTEFNAQFQESNFEDETSGVQIFSTFSVLFLVLLMRF